MCIFLVGLWLFRFEILYPVIAPFLPKPVYLEYDCWFDNPTNRHAHCGVLFVNERRGADKGDTIQIPVVTFRKAGIRVPTDPVVYIPGGPGETALIDPAYVGSWKTMLPLFDWIGDRDLILFDQRGSGLSKPSLACPEFRKLALVPRDRAKRRQALIDCRDRLLDRGIDLTAYATNAVATDLIDLRRAMGIESWNLFGIAHGTRVAFEVIQKDEAGIRTAVLAGVRPPGSTIDSNSEIRHFDVVLRRLTSACTESELCNSPLAETLRTLASSYREEPRAIPIELLRGTLPEDLKVPDRYVVDGIMVIDLIRQAFRSSDNILELPLILSDLRSGRHKSLRGLTDEWDLHTYGPNISHGAKWSAQCSDGVTYLAEPDPATGDETAIVQDWLAWHDSKHICEVWPADPSSALSQTLVRIPVPVLMLAGALDPFTPDSWAKAINGKLPNSKLAVFTNAGQDMWSTPCARDLMSQFLIDPAMTEFEDGCLRQQPVWKPTYRLRHHGRGLSLHLKNFLH